MVIIVTVQKQAVAGDTFNTPFGIKTVTEAEAASGFYMKSSSASRTVADTATVSAEAIANQGVDIIASLVP